MKKKYKAIFEASLDSIAVYDRNGIIIMMSPAGAKLFGLPSKKLIGKSLFEFLPKEKELFLERFRRAIDYNENLQVEDQITMPDGEIHWFWSTINSINKSNGESFGVEVISHDITQHKKVELLKKENEEIKLLNEELHNTVKELKQVKELIQKQNIELSELNAAKDKFFSIIAHDLRSPFSGFLGITEIMRKRDMTNEEVKEYSKMMYSSASNLFKLLENLLTWAGMQRGVIEFNPEIFSLSQITNQTVTIESEFAKQKNIEMINLVPNHLKVSADLQMLNTVFRNLISNAIKFTRRNGKITISAKEKDEEILIFIQDSGIGMDAIRLENVFRMDRKTSRSGTEGEASTGLGLLLCKDFIEKHKGKIWAESEVDKGSTFYISLPLSDCVNNT